MKCYVSVQVTYLLDSHLKAFLFSRAYDPLGLTVQEDYALQILGVSLFSFSFLPFFRALVDFCSLKK